MTEEQPTRQEVVALYKSGLTPLQIATHLDIPLTSVNAYLSATKVCRRRQKEVRARWVVVSDPSGPFSSGAEFTTIYETLLMGNWPTGLLFRHGPDLWRVVEMDGKKNIRRENGDCGV